MCEQDGREKGGEGEAEEQRGVRQVCCLQAGSTLVMGCRQWGSAQKVVGDTVGTSAVPLPFFVQRLPFFNYPYRR